MSTPMTQTLLPPALLRAIASLNTLSTRSAGCVENNVYAVVVHRCCRCFTLVRFVESARIVDFDFDTRVRSFDAGFETSFKTFDDRNFGAAYEADFACFRHFARNDAHEECAFVFGKRDGTNVRGIDSSVNDCQMRVRVLVRHGFHVLAEVETDAPSQIVFAFNVFIQIRHVIFFGFTLQVLSFDAFVFFQSIESFPSGFVKRFVVYAAHVGNQADFDARLRVACRLAA